MEAIQFDALRFHGGQIDAARRAFPAAAHPWLDLSTGLNPMPWPVPTALVPDLAALPTSAALSALEAAASDTFGMPGGSIAALPGTEIGLHLLATLDLPGPVRVVAPGYGSYARAFPAARAITFAELDTEAELGGTIILANPNNPDGAVHDPQKLIGVARRLGAKGGTLAVDEAFADVDPAISVLPHLKAEDRVLVMRSFGKFYGLAGVRLGFACGVAPLVEAMRARIGSWPVSTPALAIGTAAYLDSEWAANARADISARVGRLDAVLARHGLEAIGDCPLFRLIEDARVPALFEQLANAAILTRPFAYRADWLRIGLPGSDQDFDRLDRALSGG